MLTFRTPGILFSLAILFGCEANPGFKEIFNGKDLNGWEIKCTEQDRGKQYWYVKDGILVANSMGDSLHDYIWLQYKETLSDFHLKLKFQALKGNSGNTGIQIRSRYDEEAEWLNGPQIDIHPSGPWRTGMMWDETRGNQRWIFPDLPDGEWVSPEMAIGTAPFYYEGDAGRNWNKMEIIAEGMHIASFLNGVQITDFNGEGILDDPIHTSRQVGLEGNILLQIHTGDQLEIRFRDIELRKN